MTVSPFPEKVLGGGVDPQQGCDCGGGGGGGGGGGSRRPWVALAAFVGKEERERMEEGEGDWDGYKYGRFSK